MKYNPRDYNQFKQPCPFKLGDRILPIANFELHGYRRGESYEVVQIDTDDSTLQARDVLGHTCGWIHWRDCEKFDEIGWEWLKDQLPAGAVELLSAFEGLQNLKLRPEIRIALVERLPDLKTKVTDASGDLESKSNKATPSIHEPGTHWHAHSDSFQQQSSRLQGWRHLPGPSSQRRRFPEGDR